MASISTFQAAPSTTRTTDTEPDAGRPGTYVNSSGNLYEISLTLACAEQAVQGQLRAWSIPTSSTARPIPAHSSSLCAASPIP